MSGSNGVSDPDDVPVVGAPRCMTVIHIAVDRLDDLPVCAHLATGEEDFTFWDSTTPSRLVCERCYSAAQEAAVGSDLGCSYCGSPLDADPREISYKAADNVGMHFWMCQPCMNADFPDGLPEQAGPASPVEPSPTPAQLWMSDETVLGVLQD